MPSWCKKRQRHHKRLEELAKRSGYRCQYCGNFTTKRKSDKPRPTDGTIDHLIPRCLGGALVEGNIAFACRQCNNAKGCLLPLAFIVARIDREKSAPGNSANSAIPECEILLDSEYPKRC